MRQNSGETVEVIPSARRLVTSLRDVGYDFVHAVADLVDNSIAAGATEVGVELRFDGPDSWVRIVDNGSGMPGTTVTEAMRYGSRRQYDHDDLGKFGLGLKTASLSQCRRLTVASRTSGDPEALEARQLDLDHVEASDLWEVFVLGGGGLDERLSEPLGHGPGTVVLLENLDRVLDYKVPWGDKARNGLYRLAEQLELHLGMVFHRFIAGEVRRRAPITMTVNGSKVEPWDPFARTEPGTEPLPMREVEVRTPTGVGIVQFRPYVLPPKQAFSSERAWTRMSGPARWNAQQGLYIYRASRLIQSGGWSRMRSVDEHTKLARAAVDFFPDLDSAFEINVAKVRVGLPEDLREGLKGPVEDLVRRARQRYDHAERAARPGTAAVAKAPRVAQRPTTRPGREVADSEPGAQSAPAGGRARGQVVQTPVPALEPREALERAAAEAGEAEALGRIVRVLSERSPEVARDLGW